LANNYQIFILNYCRKIYTLFFYYASLLMFSDALRPHGFTDSESQVYTTLLELGQAPASSVARRLGENRVTVYSTLKKLVNK